MFVIGHTTPNRRAIGEILYYGSDADAANQVVADNVDKFPRIDVSLQGIEAYFRTVHQYDENHPTVAKPVDAPASDEPKPKKKKS